MTRRTCHHGQQHGGVHDRRRHRTHDVQRRRVRYEPVPRHAAVRRLQADHAAEVRGLPDAAACTGMQLQICVYVNVRVSLSCMIRTLNG